MSEPPAKRPREAEAEHHVVPVTLISGFLGAGKTPLQSVAIQIGMLLGLHPKHGPQTKETLLPYSELTCIHKYV